MPTWLSVGFSHKHTHACNECCGLPVHYVVGMPLSRAPWIVSCSLLLINGTAISIYLFFRLTTYVSARAYFHHIVRDYPRQYILKTGLFRCVVNTYSKRQRCMLLDESQSPDSWLITGQSYVRSKFTEWWAAESCDSTRGSSSFSPGLCFP